MKIFKKTRDNKGKTILILGNGFDLAHGLPTKYSHFLDFCQRVEAIYCNDFNSNLELFKHTWIDNWEVDIKLKLALEAAFRDRNILKCVECFYSYHGFNGFHSLISHNIWYEYFDTLYHANCMRGENWIDFEAEIRFVIYEIDRNTPSLTKLWDDVIKEAVKSVDNQKIKYLCKILESKVELEKGETNQITVKDIREWLYNDLQNLTKALEWYLDKHVNNLPIKVKIPEIENLTPDYVINFNYTDTYERIYGLDKTYGTQIQLFANKKIYYIRKEPEVYHIHGKADINLPRLNSDIVLGIDEYWPENERDERTNFTIFKKFAQRIQKHTGNDSYRYLEEIQNLFKAEKNRTNNANRLGKHPSSVSYVYVFGHSLDVTDKDILSSFIGDDSTVVTIYCKDVGTEGELIANTIKLIGEKRLLDKSNYIPAKLNFVLQNQKIYRISEKNTEGKSGIASKKPHHCR